MSGIHSSIIIPEKKPARKKIIDDDNSPPVFDGDMTKYLMRMKYYDIKLNKHKYDKILEFMNIWLVTYGIKLKSLMDFKNVSSKIIFKDSRHNYKIFRKYHDSLNSYFGFKSEEKSENKLNKTFDINSNIQDLITEDVKSIKDKLKLRKDLIFDINILIKPVNNNVLDNILNSSKQENINFEKIANNPNDFLKAFNMIKKNRVKEKIQKTEEKLEFGNFSETTPNSETCESEMVNFNIIKFINKLLKSINFIIKENNINNTYYYTIIPINKL